MLDQLTKYDQSCHECSRVKYKNQHPTGLLQPHPAPRGCCTDIATDLITGLLQVTHFGQPVNALLTIVDRLTRRCHF